MTRGPRSARRAHRWGIGVGVAGAGAAAAVIGMTGTPVAHADPDIAGVPDPVSQGELLGDAVANITTLNGPDELGAVPSDYQWLLGSEAGELQTEQTLMNEYQAVQESALNSDNSSLSELANLGFFLDDQQIDQASQAAVFAVGAFDSDPTPSTALTAWWDLQSLNADISGAMFPNELLGTMVDLDLPGQSAPVSLSFLDGL